MADEVLMRIENLSLHAGGRELQRDLNFDVRAGEVLAICGASGCGKSTLLRHLAGLEAPAAGAVRIEGRDLHAGDPATQDAMRRRIGVMFQAGALWTSMSVGENVMLPMRLLARWPAARCEREARFRLALVGLADAFDVAPSALSGGMRKRAAIARALALDPPLLLLDEPSAGLDPIASSRLDELIVHLRDDLGTAVVLVTHEIPSVFAVADRMLFLDAASRTMTALGPPAELRDHGPPGVREFLARGLAGDGRVARSAGVRQ